MNIPEVGFSSALMAGAATAGGVALGLPGELLGAKAGFALGGAIGGLISLAYIIRPGILARIISLCAGAAGGFYMAPVIVGYFNLTRDGGLMASLVVGLCAMPLFGGVHTMATRFRDDPMGAIQRVRNIWKGKGHGD